MPTNVSTPIWQCDLCLTKHGDNRERAELCESAPLPEQLAEGTPILSAPQGSFALSPLTATDKIDTDVSEYQSHPGHHRSYILSLPNGQRLSVNDRNLYPATPGYVQVWKDTHSRLHITSEGSAGLDVGGLYSQLGMGQPGSLAASGERHLIEWDAPVQWVDPITPEVSAVFDALGARLERTSSWSAWQVRSNRLRVIENYLLGINDGDISKSTAMGICSDPDQIIAVVEDLRRRWLAGEDVRAPAPLLTSSSTVTASRIPKALRPIIEATGFEWPARTNATDYLNMLTRRTLMTDNARGFMRGFGKAKIVAVGGVKGGVGKTTVAVALAKALSAQGKKVTLVDFDLDGPNLHVALGLDSRVAVSEDLTRLVPQEVGDGLRAFSHGQIKDILPTRWNDAEADDWVRFIGGALDVDGDDVVIIDLPAGQGKVVETVLRNNGTAQADVLVAVTTPDPSSLADAQSGLRMQMHERRSQIVVENLARVAGALPSGEVVEVRPYGNEGEVEALAAATKSAYGGSLPYARSVDDLAHSAEVADLAALVMADLPVARG